MKIGIINSAEPGIDNFAGPIRDVIDKEGLYSEIIQWRELNGIQHLKGYRAAIISASPMGNNANFEERIRSFDWLRNVDFPVLGICAGHQFIGHIFGGKLISNRESETGPTPIRIMKKDPLFEEMKQEITVVQQHHDSVTLPPGFFLLASSDRCKVQSMRHPEKPIYGVQWHAEISTPQLARNLIHCCLG